MTLCEGRKRFGSRGWCGAACTLLTRGAPRDRRTPTPIVVPIQKRFAAFGTATPSSDLDVKGVFLPTRASLYLQNAPQQFTANTNPSDSERKNTLDDVDVTVWSLQFWMKLVLRGDINAVSLLFSPSHPDATLPGSDAAFVNRLARPRAAPIAVAGPRRHDGLRAFASHQVQRERQAPAHRAHRPRAPGSGQWRARRGRTDHRRTRCRSQPRSYRDG
ncbi:MAG: hypothetical protein HC933_16475 [Pleurocapsa sp. SU_196_0]|nr:hypothetical protein [Pleurocapsa sp. SU_196_0]